MRERPHLRVFISSPSDVRPERDVAERVVSRVGDIWKSHVVLSSVRWERAHYEATKSFQEAIGDISDYDIVLGIIWKRVGTELAPGLYVRSDGSRYESGTVFELETAIAAGKARGKPKVAIFRKTEAVTFSAGSVEDEHRQYKLLQSWWNRTTRDAEGHFTGSSYERFLTIDEFEDRWQSWLEGKLRDSGYIPTGPAWDVAKNGSPYPGLLPYDSKFSAVYFGRSLAVAQALEDFETAARSAPVLFIVGPSGSGKSSMAQAGLLPHFEGAKIAGVDFWCHAVLEPSHDPVLALSERLYGPEVLPQLRGSPQSTPEAFAALARQSADGAAQVVKWAISQQAERIRQESGGGRAHVGRLLIVLDQLETIFDSAEHGHIAKLARALVDNEVAWIVATLRSDRYADLQRNPDLLDLRRRGALYDLPPPGRAEILDIIKGPALAANLEFEEGGDVSLATTIGSDVTGADALPLLQMTLAQLFEKRSGNMLTISAYKTMGGLEGAIAAHADEVFRRVSPQGQLTLDALLRSLVADIGEDGRLTLSAPKRNEVIVDEASRELVDEMTEARLLVSADGGIRVAHEALLRRWQRATASPALQPDAIRLRRRLEPSLEAWESSHSPEDFLQQGATLAAAEAIRHAHPGAFPPALDNYIGLSAAHAQSRAESENARVRAEARRARIRAYVASATAVVLLLLTIAIYTVYRKANADFTLALLTRADQFMAGEEPSHALAVATALGDFGPWAKLLGLLGLSSTGTDDAIRVRSIAQVARPASLMPVWTRKSAQVAEAASLTWNQTRAAIGYENGDIYVFPTDGTGEAQYLHGSNEVYGLAFDRTGNRLLSLSETQLLLWDLTSKSVRELARSDSTFLSVAFDPTGTYVAWTAADGDVTVFDPASSRKRIFRDASAWADAVAFSNDGSTLAYTYADGTLIVRNTRNWSERRFRTGRTDLVSVSFSANGKAVATASLWGPIDVWNLQSGSDRSPTTLSLPQDKRWMVDFSPDGRLLAVASWQGTITLFDAPTLAYAGTIDAGEYSIAAARFGKDSSLLLSAGASGAAKLWNTSTLKPMFYTTRNDSRETLAGAYSARAPWFVAGGRDGIVTAYAIDALGRFQARCAVHHDDWIAAVALSDDGDLAASVSRAEGTSGQAAAIKLWAPSTCRPVRQLPVGRQFPTAIALAPAGESVAWGTRSGAVWLSDSKGRAPQRQLSQLTTKQIDDLDFSPDGKSLVAGTGDGAVGVWDVQSGKLTQRFPRDNDSISTVRFSPDGMLVAAGDSQKQILIWQSSRPGSPVARLSVPDGVSRLAFNDGGTILAAGSYDRQLMMWSTKDWQKVFQVNDLVGREGVFGFDSTGDLAFDGNFGAVDVLPRSSGTSQPKIVATVRGLSVFFDTMPDDVRPKAVPDIVYTPSKTAARL